MDGPNGAFDDNKPAKIGIVEQEQKGVKAPNPVPYKYPVHFFGRSKTRLIRSSVTFFCNQLTKKLINKNNTVNSMKSTKKVCENCIKLLTLSLLSISKKVDVLVVYQDYFMYLLYIEI